jgi:hypothetical protein
MADTVKWGGEFLVNTTTVRSQIGSSVTALGDGRFIVIRHDYSNTDDDQSYSAVRAQIFNVDGSPSGDEFIVNTTTEGTQMPGAVTLLPDGRFVVVWTHDTGSYYVRDEIVAQSFNPNGTKSGPEFIVNTEYLLEQTDPKIATLADGRFVVTWRDNYEYPYETGDDTSISVKGQIFNADGTPVGTEFLVNTTTLNTQENAEVVGLNDGRFVVVWQDYSATGGDHLSYDVRGQVFNADGSNDFLSGSGYGVTTFVFGANSGEDLVAGFTPKATLPSYRAHDVIEIDPGVLPNFAALMAAATEDEYGHTTIRLSDTSSIVLWSVSKASLSADDFLFVSPGWKATTRLLQLRQRHAQWRIRQRHRILCGGRCRRDRQPYDVRSPEHDRRRNRYAGQHREPHRLRLRRHAFRRRLE